MVKNSNSKFEFHVLRKNPVLGPDGKEQYARFQEVSSPMGKYILAEQGQEFIIQILADSSRVWGVKLWIDEQEIAYKKTFTKQGHYFGFKLGEGNFESFKFGKTDICLDENGSSSNQVNKRSEIKVAFFRTHKEETDKLSILSKMIRKAKDSYNAPKLAGNKKYFKKPLSIQAGEIFRTDNVISEDKLLRKCYDSKRDKYFEDVIEYDQAVETISCGYGDFTSLRIQGIISMSNINHLCLMPREFFFEE